ncbi:hypothetical protein D3C87_1867180 [compost metagenome]
MERLTETEIPFCQETQSAQARSRTNLVISEISPMLSAIGMKMLGPIKPRSGCDQRTNASQHSISEPSGRYIGW